MLGNFVPSNAIAMANKEVEKVLTEEKSKGKKHGSIREVRSKFHLAELVACLLRRLCCKFEAFPPMQVYPKLASKPRLFPGEERPGLYCLRMRVIRARVEQHIMRNDVYGRAWLCL